MESVILYTTGCPRCMALKKKLNSKGILYEENNNVEEMLVLGINEVPMLKVGETLMDYSKAIKWLVSNEGDVVN
jgi:glutaredoxin